MTPATKLEPGLACWVGTVLTGGLRGRRFRVREFLAEGGMAVVFRGFEPETGAEVVVKTPRSALLADPEFHARFTREGRLLAAFDHENVVPVADIGEHDGRPFLVLPYMVGGSLRNALVGPDGKPKAYSPAALPRWLGPVASALDAINAAGYIHRDVKPDNILFDGEKKPRLTDFGIAKAMGTAGSASRTVTVATTAGHIIGTPVYMAPELLLERPADGRADQFALAATAYEFLTGLLPFPGSNGAAVTLVQQKTTDDQLRALLKDRLAPGVSEALIRGLQRNPAKRFPSSGEFARHVLGGLGAGAVPPPLPGTPKRVPTVVEAAAGGAPRPPAGPGFTRVEALPLSLDPEPLPLDDEPPRRTRPRGDELELEPDGPVVPPWVLRLAFKLVLAAVVLGGLGFAGWWGWGYMHRKIGDRATASSERKVAEGDYALALSEAERAVKNHPESARAYLARGVARERMLDFPGAFDDFNKAVELDPKLAPAYVWRCQVGMVLSEIGERDYTTERATLDVNEAIKLDPKFAPALAMRGLVYAQGKAPDFDQALKACQDAIDLKADDPWVFAIRADVRDKKARSPSAAKDDDAKADADAARAVEFARGEAAYYRFQRAMFSEKGGAAKEKEIERFARDHPGHMYTHLLNAELYGDRKEFDKATDAVREHLKACPRSFIGYVLLVVATLQKNNLDAADTNTTEAIQKFPDSPFLRMLRANLRARRGDHKKAREDLDAAVRLNPSKAEFYALRADVLRKLGEDAAAEADEKKAHELAEKK